MSTTQMPPSGSMPPPSEQRDLFEAQHWETAYRRFNPDEVPHLLIQLQDDLSKARKREAVWLSVILHLLVVILLVNSEKIMMFLPHRTLNLTAAIDLDKQKDATFLELPPDEQKLTRRPDSKVISDKDRIATSKTPQINRDELKKIIESAHPGRPGPPIPQQAAPPAPAQAQAAPQQPPPQDNQQQPQNSGLAAPAQNNQIAQLQVPPMGTRRAQPSFKTPLTAGSAIEQATQAAAANRGHYGSGGGENGDYGISQGRGGPKALDQAEILTDTMGVDFGPYLARVVQVVRQTWYSSMPESVFPPILKQGKLSIQFEILKDGKVSGIELHTSSGDVALDRAAWASIMGSNPFPPLPKEFKGEYLGLRFYYFYNIEHPEIGQ